MINRDICQVDFSSATAQSKEEKKDYDDDTDSDYDDAVTIFDRYKIIL